MKEQQPLIPLSIGERLRQAREQLNRTTAETAAALHIPEDVLLAIEAGELDRFAPVYRRGYVSAYARHLGLEKGETERLLSGLDSSEPTLHSVFPLAARQNVSDRWLRATSYVLASLLIGTLAWQFTHEAVRLSQRNAMLPEDSGQAAGTVGIEPAAEGRPATHVNASIAALEQAPRRDARVSNAGAQAWSAMNDADGSPERLPPGEHVIGLSTSADSWIEIADARGEQLELDLLRAGTRREYRGTAPFRILFGRGSAVRLFLDGEPVDTAPHTSGDVTQMTLDAKLDIADDGSG